LLIQENNAGTLASDLFLQGGAMGKGSSGKKARRKVAQHRQPAANGASLPASNKSEKGRDWSKIAVGATLIGIIVAGVVSYHVTYLNLLFSGALQKEDAVLQFGQYPLDQEQVEQVFVGISTDFNIADKVLIPVDIGVKNTGQKALENVRLTLVYDIKARAQIPTLDQYMENHGTLMPGDVDGSTNVNEDEGKIYTNYKFTRPLDPGQSRSISYPLQAYETAFSKDKIIYGVQHVEVRILLQADGLSVKTFAINYNIVPANGYDDLLDQYRLLYAGLGKIVLGKDAYSDYLVSANYRVAMTPVGRMWFPLGKLQAAKTVVHASEP
jgi:hypothetical protein